MGSIALQLPGSWLGPSTPASDAFWPLACSQPVHRAPDAEPPAVEDVGIDHRRGHIPMSQQLLDRTDIVAVLEQMGGERVPQAVAGDPLRETGIRRGQLDGALDDGLVQVVATETISAFPMPVLVAAAGGEHELPRPLPRRREATSARMLPAARPGLRPRRDRAGAPGGPARDAP
jgi:hypothetical protein